jgi:hypothetical protein
MRYKPGYVQAYAGASEAMKQAAREDKLWSGR